MGTAGIDWCIISRMIMKSRSLGEAALMIKVHIILNLMENLQVTLGFKSMITSYNQQQLVSTEVVHQVGIVPM